MHFYIPPYLSVGNRDFYEQKPFTKDEAYLREVLAVAPV